MRSARQFEQQHVAAIADPAQRQCAAFIDEAQRIAGLQLASARFDPAGRDMQPVASRRIQCRGRHVARVQAGGAQAGLLADRDRSVGAIR